MDVITIKNKQELKTIENPDGKLVYNGEDQKYYYLKEGEWIQTPVQINSEGELGINLYELNKQLIQQLDYMTEEQLKEASTVIGDFMSGDCYMLYGKDIGYFTLFMKDEKSPEDRVGLVFECLHAAFGDNIYSIELNEEKTAIEIWVNFQEMVTVLYLFDYSQGIVYYG